PPVALRLWSSSARACASLHSLKATGGTRTLDIGRARPLGWGTRIGNTQSQPQMNADKRGWKQLDRRSSAFMGAALERHSVRRDLGAPGEWTSWQTCFSA